MTQSAPPPVTHSAPPPVTHPSAPQQKPAKPPPPTTGVSVNKMHAVQTARRLLDDEIFVTAGLFRNWLFFCLMIVFQAVTILAFLLPCQINK